MVSLAMDYVKLILLLSIGWYFVDPCPTDLMQFRSSIRIPEWFRGDAVLQSMGISLIRQQTAGDWVPADRGLGRRPKGGASEPVED